MSDWDKIHRQERVRRPGPIESFVPRRKRRRNFQRWVAKKKQTKRNHFPIRERQKHMPDRTWYLEMPCGHISMWVRKHGRIRCLQSPPPYDWFLRVNNVWVVKEYLSRNGIHFPKWHDKPPQFKCLPDCPSKAVQSQASPGASATASPEDISKREASTS